MKLLDTTFLVDLVRGKGEIKQKLAPNEEYLTTQINMFELIRGFMLRGTKSAKILEIADLFDSIRVLPFDNTAMIKSAEISAELSKNGATIGDADCLIAGIAIANGVSTIVTRNDKDFKRIKGLKIETY